MTTAKEIEKTPKKKTTKSSNARTPKKTIAKIDEPIKVQKPKAIPPKEEPMNAPAELSKVEKAHAFALFNSMEKELKSAENSFLKVAFILTEIAEKSYYKELGFKNIYDFGKTKYNLARGTVNGFINVVNRFGLEDKNGSSPRTLKEDFKEYSSSKLLAMLPLKEDELTKVNPSMSVRQIKEVVKSLSPDKDSDSDKETPDNKDTIIDVESTEILENLVLCLTSDVFAGIGDDVKEKHLENLLLVKVKVIMKLLDKGHEVRIVDRFSQYPTVEKGEK